MVAVAAADQSPTAALTARTRTAYTVAAARPATVRLLAAASIPPTVTAASQSAAAPSRHWTS